MIETKWFYIDGEKSYGIKFLCRKILTFFLEFYYSIVIRIFKPKNKRDEKKFKVSICGIFRDEALYLKEWIEFHKIVGVDHFYLYNNFSNDNYLDVLEPYIENNLITLVDWPKEHSQIEAYIDCINKYSSETEWLGFIDIDEFVVPNNTDNIFDFLKKFQRRPAVLIYWQLFGSSGKMNRNLNDLVTDDFFCCWKKYYGMGKCFYNTKYNYSTNKNTTLHHMFWSSITNDKKLKISLPCVNEFDKVVINNFHQRVSLKYKKKDFPIQINHYHTKTWFEYQTKINRKGDVYFAENPKNLEYFLAHDMKCETTDYHILKYMIKLKIAMGIKY